MIYQSSVIFVQLGGIPIDQFWIALIGTTIVRYFNEFPNKIWLSLGSPLKWVWIHFLFIHCAADYSFEQEIFDVIGNW